jgi:hypothetical protein
MQLVPEWRRVLLRAWSSRVLIAAGALAAAATAVSLIDGQSIGHPALIPALSFGLNMAALFVRLLPQKGITDGR